MSQLHDMQDMVAAWCERKGWRGEGSPARTFGDDIALLHSECSEALEAYRLWGTDEMVKFPSGLLTTADSPDAESFVDQGGVVKPEGIGSELADVLIRLLDTCATYNIDLEQEFYLKMEYNETREHRHGGKLL